ncbi:MAG: hypothetical protein ACOYN0_10645, partial [Phycisphaerales bacterium]
MIRRPLVLALIALLPTHALPALATGGDGWTAVIDGEEIPAPAIPMGDDEIVRKILDEGKNRNQVMEHLRHLTKEIGPRLTASTRAQLANEWCKDQYTAWGLENPRVEQWGEYPVRFDRGPSTAAVFLRREKKDDAGEVTAIEYDKSRDLEFSTLAWTKGTDGPKRAPVVKEPRTEEDYAAVKDKLSGAWILLRPPPAVGQRGIRGRLSDHFQRRIEARKKVDEGTAVSELSISQRMVFDGVAGWISSARDERVWTGAAPEWSKRELADIPDDVHVVIRGSDYDYINSRLADQDPIEVEINADHALTAGPVPAFNTIAEIRGTEF